MTSVWKPRAVLLPDKAVEIAYAGCEALDARVGWIRFPTDGTRLQVFDPYKRVICKVSKQHAGFKFLMRELDCRSSVGGLAPIVRGVSEYPPAYLEDWIEGRSGCGTLQELRSVLEYLTERLYQTTWLDLGDYVRRVGLPYTNRTMDRIMAAMHLIGWDKLPVSPVHGDLVSQNIFFRPNGAPVLIDWEYARPCVVSHDLWFYLYHRARSNILEVELPATAFIDIAQEVKWLGLEVNNVRALHLIHLLERKELLRSNSSVVDSSFALSTLQYDIEQVSKQLKIEEYYDPGSD